MAVRVAWTALASVIFLTIFCSAWLAVLRDSHDPEKLRLEHERSAVELFERGMIIRHCALDLFGKEVCLSVVSDERQVEEGIITLDEDILELDYDLWQKYRVRKIKHQRLAIVTVQKPFAFSLKPCSPR